jgi:hypothetical protein
LALSVTLPHAGVISSHQKVISSHTFVTLSHLKASFPEEKLGSKVLNCIKELKEKALISEKV